MNKLRNITTPLTKEVLIQLRAGDEVLLSGVIYTARDAAHKRLVELIVNGKELPFNINNAILYYVGPTPAREGQIIGSAGPTTSSRMDGYTPPLLTLGLSGMIGKGDRGGTTIASMIENKAVYFTAIGGASALIAKCIIKCDIICYEDLSSEAIRRLEVREMPLTVAIDSLGNNLFRTGQQAYLDSIQSIYKD